MSIKSVFMCGIIPHYLTNISIPYLFSTTSCNAVLEASLFVKVYFYLCNVCPPDLLQKNSSLKEKRHAISEMMSEIQQKEMQKDAIIQKMEKLGEDQAKRKECML